MRTYLAHPDLGVAPIKAFCAAARSHGTRGAAFKRLLAEFAEHGDMARITFPTEQAAKGEYTALVQKIVESHAGLVAADPASDRTANYLVGQVMATIADRRSVDARHIKEMILAAMDALPR